MTDILSLIFLIVFLIIMVSFVYASISIAPWVPSKKKDFKRINRLADLKHGQIFYELGCGDGRVCRYIAKKNPQAKVVGIELSIAVYIWALIKKLMYGPSNMQVKFGDALKSDLRNADVIYTFAITESINNKLKKKFERELKPDAKVLSYVFSIHDWKGNTKVDKPDDSSVSIYTYTL